MLGTGNRMVSLRWQESLTWTRRGPIPCCHHDVLGTLVSSPWNSPDYSWLSLTGDMFGSPEDSDSCKTQGTMS